MPFVKGQSGNPRGRPKQTEKEKEQKEQFKALLNSATVPSLKSIIQIANNSYSKDRFNACKYILDRAYGVNNPMLIEELEERDKELIVKIIPFRKSNDDEDWSDDD